MRRETRRQLLIALAVAAIAVAMHFCSSPDCWIRIRIVTDQAVAIWQSALSVATMMFIKCAIQTRNSMDVVL